MTAETPQQIDLSQDLESQGITLSPDQQTNYEAYLATLEAAERQEVIYLTQAELEEFKQTLEYENNHHQDRNEVIDDFLEEQIEEGLSSQDIVGLIEGNLLTPELLQTLDGVSHNILFDSENGVFKGLEISDTAKDTIGVSLTFSLIEDIKSHTDVITSVLDDGSDIATILAENYSEIFGNINTAFSEYQDISGEPFTVPGEGENNGIFMELDTGKDFFGEIISGEITKDNVITHINEANTDNRILPSTGDISVLRDIGSFTQEELTALIAAAAQTVTNGEPTGDPQVNPDTTPTGDPETPLTALERLAASGGFGAFIAAILEVLQGFIANTDASGNTTRRNPERNTPGPTPEEIAPQTRENIRSFFTRHASEGIFTNMTRESILSLFPESGELSETAQNIIRKIEALPGEQSIDEKMQHLFIAPVRRIDGDPSSGTVPRMERFLSDMREVAGVDIQLMDTDNTLRPEQLESAIIAYNSYREANISWLENTTENPNRDNLTFREFFQRNVDAGNNVE